MDDIKRAAVLGSGVMGGAIAAHLANCGIPSLMLDIVPPGLSAEDRQDPAKRNALAAASKAALDNMTRSFARKLAPEVKVNSIAPSLILFNEHDDAEYRQQALNKSLMKTAPGEKEVIDLVDYLLTSCFVTGRSLPLDGGRHLR